MSTMTRTDTPGSVAMGKGERVAVVAGSGVLPVEVVDALAASGHRPLVVAIGGEAGWPDRPETYDILRQAPEDLGSLVGHLKQRHVTHLVLAGGVSSRPPLRDQRITLGFLRFLPRLVAAYARGDDRLLRTIIEHIEKSGIRVVGAHEIVPDLLAREGVMTEAQPTKADRRDIAAGLEAARAIGRLDIGQAAVAIGGRAIALEGIEGTDGLLARTRDLRGHGRIAGRTRGVLVKCAKPDQEARADLPAIGPDTIDASAAAGLAGVAVEAGRSFILDHARTIERADALGLFVIGLRQGEGT